jgi:hypothetical protein
VIDSLRRLTQSPFPVLTFKEFQKFVSELPEPFRTMALLCLCLGLRISECLALKWADIDWLAAKITLSFLVEEDPICMARIGVSVPSPEWPTIPNGKGIGAISL